MPTRIRWGGDAGAFVSIEGVVEPGEVDVLVALVERLRRSARVTLDFHNAEQISDLALVQLAHRLSSPDDTHGCALVGLREHHHRLLRYAGVDA